MTERAKNLRQRADEAVDVAMRRMEESGELEHMHGRPLDLDADPDWLVNRVLKEQGFSHPLLELGKDLVAPAEAADKIIAKLRRRRTHLTRTGELDVGTARRFNEGRIQVLGDYRAALEGLNRAITDYNLRVPTALHKRPIGVDEVMGQIAAEIPALAPTPPAPLSKPSATWRERHRRKKA